MEQFVHSSKSLGSAIRRQRKIKNLNQTDAGTKFCISQDTFSSIEQGASGTRLETLFRALAALDLEMVIKSKNRINVKKADKW